MNNSDERDYDEENANRREMEREGLEELEYERAMEMMEPELVTREKEYYRLERLGLSPEEHNHGKNFSCVECHDFDNCEDQYCLFC